MVGHCTDTQIVKGLVLFAYDKYLSPFGSRMSTRCRMDIDSWLNAHLMPKIFPMQGVLRPADMFYLGAMTASLVSLTGVTPNCPLLAGCPTSTYAR